MTQWTSITGEGRTENDALIEAAKAAAEPTIVHQGEELLILALPPGQTVETIDLNEYAEWPRRRKGSVTLQDAASFVLYVNRHKSDATTLYGNADAGRITAVLNDHSGHTDELEAVPGWGDFRAVLQVALTKEWQHWTSKNDRLLKQVEFAEHIEQGLDEIVKPPAAEMLELAQHFEAHNNVAFKSVKVLADGRRNLLYEETIEARAGQKGDISIPREFEMGVAPYEGSDRFKVTARLRYRLNDGSLAIGYVLVRPHDVLKAAFADVLTKVESGTGLTVLRGSYGG